MTFKPDASDTRLACDAIIETLVANTGETWRRDPKGYYRYGADEFNTHNGTPPQAKFVERSLTLGQPDDAPQLTGIAAKPFNAIHVNMTCRVWAESMQRLFNEVFLLTRAINSNSSSSMSTDSQEIDIGNGADYQVSKLGFFCDIPFTVPVFFSGSMGPLATIRSASYVVSSSNELPLTDTSETLGWHGPFVVTGSLF